ncbi:MAG: efflux RND transporter periplasmic adaptor subunit [Burkholderiales bacterium]|jgi:membrane fusion protein (multidrug efflux system)|nr:efflux RND transporter periplasmic adaptor subunit [Burkholderiales bacterium]
MRRIVYLAAAVALLVAAGFAWRHYSKPQPAPAAKPAAKPAAGAARALPVKVATVRRDAVTDSLTAVGTLLANESVMIRPEIDGRIEAIHFQEGQLVRRGDKLVSLDAAEVEAQLTSAIAAANLNRSRLKRSEELFEKKFISAQALDEARENLNQTNAREAEIRARLAKSVIRAPFEGVAGLRQVSPGAYAKAGQDIARLEGIGTLKLDFRAPEAYLRRLRTGQALAVTVDAWPGERFSGTIYAIEPAVDEASRTVLVRARLPNPGVRLKPGMFARVSLVLEQRDNALLVPEQAIVPRGDGLFVFRVDDGKVRLTKVETGLRRPGEIEITGGLEAGQTVVADGQLRLQDGAAVSVSAPKPQPAQ